MENYLKGKRVLFMGDSITSLYMGTHGWPKYFCEMLEPAHHACVAVAGAHWCDYPDTEYDGNPIYVSTHNPNNTMGNQVEKLKRQKAAGNPDYADFDVIIMAAGTNDAMPESAEVTDAQFYVDGAYVPLEKADRLTWGGSIRYVSESLYELYPNAYQFICTPVQADDKIRGFRSILEKGRVLKEIAARLSVRYIDTLYCGIYGRYEKWDNNGRSLADGLHPNENGARQMAFFIANAVKSYLG
jgi:lysophospholipase L1-like esterase